jgi:mRNA-degrading endonuclease RelE of RelBE toxin-antitoxin system
MEIFFKPTFIKDFKKLPKEIKLEVKKICIDITPNIKYLRDLKNLDIKPIRGFKDFYRIKINDYRIGFKKEKIN